MVYKIKVFAFFILLLDHAESRTGGFLKCPQEEALPGTVCAATFLCRNFFFVPILKVAETKPLQSRNVKGRGFYPPPHFFSILGAVKNVVSKADNCDLHTCAAPVTAKRQAKRATRAWCSGLALWDLLIMASGRSCTRGMWAHTILHPPSGAGLDDAPGLHRALRILGIHSFPTHSTCGWIPLVGIPVCEDLKWGSSSFPLCSYRLGLGICNPGKQQLTAFSLESLSRCSLSVSQEALSSQRGARGWGGGMTEANVRLAWDSLSGKRQRYAKTWQWAFAQGLRLSGCRPSREPTKGIGCWGRGRGHRPAGGLFSPGFLSHLLSGPHLSGLQKSPPPNHPEPGFHL